MIAPGGSRIRPAALDRPAGRGYNTKRIVSNQDLVRKCRRTAMKKGTDRKAAGRPRDEAATASIMRAALELANEAGFDALSVEGVAARAGVGKTTIYRRWANVWAVVMDAVLADVTRAAPIEEHATARASFRASMRSLAKAYRGKAGKLLRPLIGRAQVDADLRQAVQE